jgi:hypothetical protein
MAECNGILAQSDYGALSAAFLPIHVCCAERQSVLRRAQPDEPIP